MRKEQGKGLEKELDTITMDIMGMDITIITIIMIITVDLEEEALADAVAVEEALMAVVVEEEVQAAAVIVEEDFGGKLLFPSTS